MYINTCMLHAASSRMYVSVMCSLKVCGYNFYTFCFVKCTTFFIDDALNMALLYSPILLVLLCISFITEH